MGGRCGVRRLFGADRQPVRPWQEPPCVADENDPDERDPQAQWLLRRMLKAGLSRYEPDPRTAPAKNTQRRIAWTQISDLSVTLVCFPYFIDLVGVFYVYVGPIAGIS
jgi:hypothetical protein